MKLIFIQIKQRFCDYLFLIVFIPLLSFSNTQEVKAQVITHYDSKPLVQKSGICGLSLEIDSVVMPAVDVEALIEEDKERENQPYIPFRFGYAIDVNFGLDNSGTWNNSNPEGKIWKLKIISKDAYSINLIFDEFYLPEFAVLYIYNEDGTMIYGPVTSLNNNSSGVFASDLLSGDAIILEYFEPFGVIKQGKINISKVIHGYKDMFGLNKNQLKGYGGSGACNIDIICDEGKDWCIEAEAVALILTNSNTEVCSGCMINNVREDLTPYFLTADHCLSGLPLNSAIFRFHYKNSYCKSTEGPNPYWWSFTGATLKANNVVSDFALLELDDTPISGMGIHYAGWSNLFIPPVSPVGIHHPQGDVMKISLSNNTATDVVANGYKLWEFSFNQGIIEYFSSGSPLFNQDKHIVGQLHGFYEDNPISCDNPYAPVVYGRFDLSWGFINGWLDPDYTGAESIDATSDKVYIINRTFEGTHKLAALTEMHLEGNVTVSCPYTPAPWYCPPDNMPLTTEPGSNVTIKAGKRIVCKRGHFKEGSKVYVSVGDITCDEDIAWGDVVGFPCLAAISFKSAQVDNNSDINDEEKIVEEDLQLNNYSDIFNIYPNPNKGNFDIILSENTDNLLSIEITNIMGSIVYKKEKIQTNPVNIDISNHPNGIYIVKVFLGDKVFVEKIIYQ